MGRIGTHYKQGHAQKTCRLVFVAFFSVKALVCVCSLYRTKKIPFGNHVDTCYIRSREEGNVTTITLDVFRLAGYPLEFFDNGAAITHTAHKDRFICFFFASSNQTGPSVSWPTCLVVMSFFLFGGWGCPPYRDILKERL